jgi:hypothetical protein
MPAAFMCTVQPIRENFSSIKPQEICSGYGQRSQTTVGKVVKQEEPLPQVLVVHLIAHKRNFGIVQEILPRTPLTPA